MGANFSYSDGCSLDGCCSSNNDPPPAKVYLCRGHRNRMYSTSEDPNPHVNVQPQTHRKRISESDSYGIVTPEENVINTGFLDVTLPGTQQLWGDVQANPDSSKRPRSLPSSPADGIAPNNTHAYPMDHMRSASVDLNTLSYNRRRIDVVEPIIPQSLKLQQAARDSLDQNQKLGSPETSEMVDSEDDESATGEDDDMESRSNDSESQDEKDEESESDKVAPVKKRKLKAAKDPALFREHSSTKWSSKDLQNLGQQMEMQMKLLAMEEQVKKLSSKNVIAQSNLMNQVVQ